MNDLVSAKNVCKSLNSLCHLSRKVLIALYKHTNDVSDSLKLAKGMDLCSFVARGISYPRVPDLAFLNCFFIISLLFSVQSTVKGQSQKN